LLYFIQFWIYLRYPKLNEIIMSAVINKWGNSLGVRIPKSIAIKAGLKEGIEVDIEVEGDRITISPVKKKYQLDDLLAGVTPELIGGEYDWGQPVGKEIW
jgi:antitoxin MazE